jgi:hypothetical protein
MSAFNIIASYLCMAKGLVDVAIWWAIMAGFFLAMIGIDKDKE